MKLSIIVPAYNVGKYLGKCIRSLLDQDLAPDDYEIIVVDDSSPDRSRAIAERLAAQHPHIRVITQSPNQGQGAARNLGMDHARGEWLLFVDADDYLEPRCLAGMLAVADDQRLDILALRYKGVDEAGHAIDWGPLPHPVIRETGTIAGSQYLLCNDYSCTIPTYMFRHTFIDRYGLRIVPGMVHEDEEFIPRALYLAERVRNYPVPVYYYLRREGSTMTGFSRRNVGDMLKAMGSLLRFARGGAVTDHRVVRHLEERVSTLVRYAMRMNLRGGFIPDAEFLAAARENGLLPLPNPGRRFNVWMFNHFPRLYMRAKSGGTGQKIQAP